MGKRLQKADASAKHVSIRKAVKKGVSRFMRRAAKLDPENAPTKKRYEGFLS